MMVNGDDLKQLAAQKEKEWRDVQEMRANSLEAALCESEKSLQEYKAKFNKLKDDFKYNLKLLKERDDELAKYDKQSITVKQELTSHAAEVSELRVALDEARSALEREKRSREDMTSHYQQRVRAAQAQLEQYRTSKEAEKNKERFELENTRRELERRIVQQQEEMDAQHSDLTTGFEEELRKRDHEHRKQIDSCNATVLAHEMKVKLLIKELELMKAAQKTVEGGYGQRDTALRDLEKKLQHREYELHDNSAVHVAKIRELELKLQQAESAVRRAQEDYTRKHYELNRVTTEKDNALTAVKTAAAERERSLEENLRHVTSRVEGLEAQVRQLEWEKTDLVREKDSQIERLQDELEDVKSRFESRVSEIVREDSSRDQELEKLRENEQRLREELSKRKQDVDRYKKEVESGLAREATLERSKAQLELDWQRRCEKLQGQQYDNSEQLVRKLTQARDEAQALLKEKVRELKHKCDVLTVMSEDRDRALATLRQHGLVADKNLDLSKMKDLPTSAAKQIEDLQQQNENLRHVVHQMRSEMESLGSEVKDGQGGPVTEKLQKDGIKHSVASDYVTNLENEIKSLKRKCRDLEQRADDALGAAEQDDVKVKEAVGDNMLVTSHIERLNTDIGKLRSEKVEVTAQCRKQQARIQYLESQIDELTKQPRELQVKLEQLRYEQAAEGRRSQAEVASLQGRLRELEAQLNESRREADEYMKASIEANNQVTSLGQQLSMLKVSVANAQPTVNFGAQEILIQQLQDEISQLRSQLKTAGQNGDVDLQAGLSANTGGGGSSGELDRKLRQAVKQIGQLAKEKQQLIDMGNRLRAELHTAKTQGPPGPPRQAFQHTAQETRYDPSANQFTLDYRSQSRDTQMALQATSVQSKLKNPVSSIHGNIQNKLSQLENLQYELTKHELTYQQRYGEFKSRGGVAGNHQVPVLSLESSQELDPVESGTNGNQPKSILKKSIDFMEKLSPVPEYGQSPTPRPRSSASQRQPYSSRTDRTDALSSSPAKDGVQPLRISMSSVGGESLQEVWKLLDDGVTPRTSRETGPFPGLSFPGDGNAEATKTTTSASIDRPKTAPNLSVTGNRNPLKPKPCREPLQKHGVRPDAKSTGKVAPQKKAGKTGVIRNWNVKEDTKVN